MGREVDIPFELYVHFWRQSTDDLPGLTDEELDELYEQRERQEAEKRTVEEGLETESRVSDEPAGLVETTISETYL
jgi:hypothetical protein